ncbi:response regulator [Desulfogranum mediterraneum]|uniref:response regulator n=1 Tax=Desulfogranum mediterraneum TaxID=160661 RepID=UPI00040CD621|nr:response regulator [Desulfogranum mediterraneum]
MDISPHELTAPDLQNDQLLDPGEVILVVDDFIDIVQLLQEFLSKEQFPTITAHSAQGLRQALGDNNVALVLLDIGLPDADGMELLPELTAHDQDLSVIMLTAVNDLQTALSCIRHGADDYLTKPVHFMDLLATLRKVLEKRRLKINNRRYQRQLEQARFRIQLAHELSIKMNTAFLSLVDLDEILKAILVGITADEGLQFNRAFLALFDSSGQVLEGRMAIGPGSREDGGRIWRQIQEVELDFQDLLSSPDMLDRDQVVNRIVKALRVDAGDEEHILIRAVQSQRSILVDHGECEFPVPVELLGLLQEESFVVVPLFSSNRPLGVIIADHFITGKPISAERIQALESFASQASLAIEHCRLYLEQRSKVAELEAMTRELEKNKDLLVEAERYSVVGHMAAQLAHNIRNPITSIGGTARLLSRKTKDPEWLQFLNMMTTEAEKIEGILEDLFSFVEKVKPALQLVPMASLVKKALLLHYTAFKDKEIAYQLLLPDEDPELWIDPQLIQKVMVHLIRNSIEAMPAGGELIVEVCPKEQELEVIFADNGVGISQNHLEQVAEPFFTTKSIGTGIGLTLVKRVVEDHHGSLEVAAGPEGGTRAVIRLPLLQSEEGGEEEG